VHVPYEKLVADPETHLRAICTAAGLEYTPDLIEYQKASVDGEGLGDPIGVQQHDRPTTASVDKWARSVAGDEKRTALLQKMLAALQDEDLATFGFTRESVWDALAQVTPEQAEKARKKAKKWDRYAVERRALLVLRRNIHHNALGRLLTKVRFYCDVLLRE
jgi:hypothetical protein